MKKNIFKPFLKMKKCLKCDEQPFHTSLCYDHYLTKNDENFKLCGICDACEESPLLCRDCYLSINDDFEATYHFLNKFNIEYHITDMLFDDNVNPTFFFDMETHILLLQFTDNQNSYFLDNDKFLKIKTIIEDYGNKSLVYVCCNHGEIKHLKKNFKINDETKNSILFNHISYHLNKKYYKFEVKMVYLLHDCFEGIYQFSREKNITNVINVFLDFKKTLLK